MRPPERIWDQSGLDGAAPEFTRRTHRSFFSRTENSRPPIFLTTNYLTSEKTARKFVLAERRYDLRNFLGNGLYVLVEWCERSDDAEEWIFVGQTSGEKCLFCAP